MEYLSPSIYFIKILIYITRESKNYTKVLKYYYYLLETNNNNHNVFIIFKVPIEININQNTELKIYFFRLFKATITLKCSLLCKGKLTNECGLGGLFNAHSRPVYTLFK